MNTPSGTGTEDNSLSTDARLDGIPQSIRFEHSSPIAPNDDLAMYQTGGNFGLFGELDWPEQLDSFEQHGSFEQHDSAEQKQVDSFTSYPMYMQSPDPGQPDSANSTLAVGADCFSPTRASQPPVAAPDVSTPYLSPSRPGSSPRGTKWTEEMNAFFLERKKMRETHKVIAGMMWDKFGVSVNPNILSKRYKALFNGTLRIMSILEDELKKLAAGDDAKWAELKQDLHGLFPHHSQILPEVIRRLTHLQSQARGA
ncbi:hypothetical protein J3459_017006 [Metarhizium acridum]|uniref:uncharacterized protein n=1 Tax=Metarhizium acridum TaxID=92637 RepID=UPI001C6C4AD1|nr:hypothetical protein J3459_017006 [Metarhizium acridum]KAG8411568.1 hypothetical protein J3458_015627 [Metarhizium acridum]